MVTVKIPKPIQIVIDDLGWWRGVDGHAVGQPFRSGISRDHVLEDYEALISLGKALGVKPQAAFVLCEWDRENILRKLPSSTWMGHDWDNNYACPELFDEAADLLNRNREYFEFTLHGIGHEYWHNGEMSRAEWFDVDGIIRPDVREHLDYYAALMEMNGLGGFPESFVPCAFYYRFGGVENSLSRVLNEYGVKHVSSPFATMHFSRPPETPVFGFDNGIITIDRGTDMRKWLAIGQPPVVTETVANPIFGLHWANILDEDPCRNQLVVDRWVEFFQRHDRMLEWTLAIDIHSFCTQLAHETCADMRMSGHGVTIDFSGLRQLPWEHFGDELTVKVAAEDSLRFSVKNGRIIGNELRVDKAQHVYTITLDIGDSQADWIALDWS